MSFLGTFARKSKVEKTAFNAPGPHSNLQVRCFRYHIPCIIIVYGSSNGPHNDLGEQIGPCSRGSLVDCRGHDGGLHRSYSGRILLAICQYSMRD